MLAFDFLKSWSNEAISYHPILNVKSSRPMNLEVKLSASCDFQKYQCSATFRKVNNCFVIFRN